MPRFEYIQTKSIVSAFVISSHMSIEMPDRVENGKPGYYLIVDGDEKRFITPYAFETNYLPISEDRPSIGIVTNYHTGENKIEIDWKTESLIEDDETEDFMKGNVVVRCYLVNSQFHTWIRTKDIEFGEAPLVDAILFAENKEELLGNLYKAQEKLKQQIFEAETEYSSAIDLLRDGLPDNDYYRLGNLVAHKDSEGLVSIIKTKLIPSELS